MCSLSGLQVTRLLVMGNICHQRYAHQHLMTLTWTPSPPRLPALYVSLPLVSSPVVIVSVSCWCAVRGYCCVRLFIESIHSLNFASRLSAYIVTLPIYLNLRVPQETLTNTLDPTLLQPSPVILH
jgi:hypothetical protein